MIKNDLRFLLKDKYSLSEIEIEEYINNGNLPSNTDLNLLNKDIELLKSDFPLAYIIGYVDFLECKIDLQYKPLIPRIETEYWVEKSYPEDNKKFINILDMFCGSGCIGISLLKKSPSSHVTFIDIDGDAIKQTEFNLELNGIGEDRYKIVKSNLFSELSSEDKFDYIYANPPYVSIYDQVQTSIKHEPDIALYSHDNGIQKIALFLKNAPKYLIDDGKIYLEFGTNQKNKIDEIMQNLNYSNWQFHKDQFSRWRWVEINA